MTQRNQKRISIVNFKGGVGKTTLALHLATGLASYGEAEVLLVDVDHQSTLSLVCLGGRRWNDAVSAGKTVDAIFQHFVSQDKPLPGTDIVHRRPYATGSSAWTYGGDPPKLDLIPSTLQLDETELDLSSTTVGNAIESEWAKRSLICKWIDKNNIAGLYDYVIFDCPPATKLVTQNAIAASHGFIVPVIPEAVSVRGVPHLITRVMTKIDKKFEGLAQYLSTKGYPIQQSYVPVAKLVGIVISMIIVSGRARSGYTSDQTTHLENLKRSYPSDIVEPYIVHGVGVPEALSDGYPVYPLSKWQNIRNRDFIEIFTQLTYALKARIDAL